MEMKFNPNESKTLNKLNSMTEQEIIKRYIKKHHAHSPTLRSQFREELNKSDKDNNYIHSSVTVLQGANLNYIYSELFKKYYSTLIDLGYQFRVENLLDDLTDLFNEDTDSTLEASDLPNRLSSYVQDVVAAYDRVLSTKVIEPLKTNSNNLNI